MDQNTQSEPPITVVVDVDSTPTNATPSSNESNPTPTQVSPSKRKLTSSVWNDFERVKVNGAKYVICHHCKTKLKAESRNGTKHLHNHLARCRKRKGTDIRQQLLASRTSVDGKVKFGNFTFDQEFSRTELANAIILHEYPLNIVEHIGFRKFVSSLQPLFKIVSRNTIRSDVLKLYQSEKTKVYSVFDQLQSRVAITTDMWSSRQKRGYMAVTAHFIDEFWRLNNMVIGFVYVPAPHTKEILSDTLLDCLLDWNLDRKVSTITVDNCTTNDAIISILSDKLTVNNSLVMDGKLLHMRCVAHILNLIVKDGLEVIGGAIGKIRDSVAFWTATQSRTEKFEDAASQLKFSCKKKLSLDCKTRWNSTYLMLETALAYKDVFPRLRQREKLYASLPSTDDWKLAEDICGRLKLFYSITEVFSGTQYPTMNFLFPKICEVKLALRSWSCSTNEVIQNMALNMIEKFEKYWGDCHVLAAIAVVLDPRYKMKLVGHGLRKIFGEDCTSYVDHVRQTCYDLLYEYQDKFTLTTAAHHSGGPSGATLSSGSENVVGEYDIFCEYDTLVSENQPSGGNVKSELDHYLDENVIPRTTDFDILNWWKVNGNKYPTLQCIARDILAVPVSTVASESAFSTSGRMVSVHRSRLSPPILQALMCTQDWLWNGLKVNTSQEDSIASSTSRTTMCDEESDEV